MPRSDEDLSDELLALAGDSEGKQHHQQRKKRGGSSKKRKHDTSMDSDSDKDEPESEDEDKDDGCYPLEGKFKDEEDREYLLSLSEIKREAILSSRSEKLQKQNETKALERMVKLGGANGGSANAVDGDVYKAAKRKHTALGSTKEKSRTLEALKEKRQAKESRRAKKSRGSDSPPLKRQRSSTPESSSEDEEGQYQPSPNKNEDPVKETRVKDETITIDDLQKVRVTRDMLEKHCMASWFEEYVKGAWVRLLVGMEKDTPVHRLCEIVDVSSQTVEPYQINNKTVNQQLELKHGGSVKAFPMNKISCGAFTDREFDRIIKTLQFEKVKLPTKSKLDKKAEEIQKYETHKLTELEIANMIARQAQIRNKPTASQTFFEKARLNQARMLAAKKGDHAELQQLNEAMARLEQNSQSPSKQSTTSIEQRQRLDALVRVNVRNRRANLDGVRKAELEIAAKRRKEALSGGPIKVDLSARVKTVPKIRHDSRSGTPLQNGIKKDDPTPSPLSSGDTALSTSPSGVRSTVDRLATSVILDLGDF